VPIATDKLAINVHTRSMILMAMSYDDSLLFTTGEDGVLYVFNIRDKDNLTRNPERSLFSAKVQTTKAKIDEKINQLRTAKAERACTPLQWKVISHGIYRGNERDGLFLVTSNLCFCQIGPMSAYTKMPFG
jgi:hypothetical protein